jgi:hypothetical protein
MATRAVLNMGPRFLDRRQRTVSRMHVVLALPGLLALSDAAAEARRAPALARLIASAGAPTIEDGVIATALATHYGIERQADWPLAPIRLAALGVDPGAAFWLCADPVTLIAGRADVRLGGIVDDLGPADAEALLETLNRHFADDGLVFAAPRPDAFFVRAPHVPQIVTHALGAAANRSLRTVPLTGPHADTWQRWQSEIQMLLHEHPVNLARQRGGLPPANSLWFSGGGTLPRRNESEPSIRTFANGGIAAALGQFAGSPARAVPAAMAAALDEAAGAALVVVALDPPLDAVAVEAAWAAPAWSALAAGRLASVTLLTEAGGEAIAWHARRPGLWQRLSGRFRRGDLAALLAAGRAGGGSNGTPDAPDPPAIAKHRARQA